MMIEETEINALQEFQKIHLEKEETYIKQIQQLVDINNRYIERMEASEIEIKKLEKALIKLAKK